MIEIRNVSLPLSARFDHNDRALRRIAAHALGVGAGRIVDVRLLKRSVDARHKSDIHFVATLGAALADKDPSQEELLVAQIGSKTIRVRTEVPQMVIPQGLICPDVRPIVVGAGPAGLFAGLYLALAGLRPVVIERGWAIEERVRRVRRFLEGGPLDPCCNVQFGEGGAGTFSDGKLTTNTHDPRNRTVLRWFVDAGAPEEILWQAHPHIGTDLLVAVVRNLREQIIAAGGEVRFGCRLAKLHFERASDGSARLVGAVLETHPHVAEDAVVSDAQEDEGLRTYPWSEAAYSAGFETPLYAHAGVAVDAGNADSAGNAQGTNPTALRMLAEVPVEALVLATGHSARDTFAMLNDKGVLLECKPFAVGVRIEHLQKIVNRAQWGRAAGHPALGAAEYKLVQHLGNNRTVFSFCMCPGGQVVASSSEPGCVVTNGMSTFARDGVNANSGLLVNVTVKDLDASDPLSGVRFQRRWEQLAYELGGRSYAAPAQLVGDFLACRASTGPGDVQPSYQRGVEWTDLHGCLPGFVTGSLAQALPLLDRKLHGFARADAVLTGVETRSSSPVRIERDLGLEAVGHAGLYPCGEGAGYAGGIMSAAVDGLRVAEAVAMRYQRT